MGGGRRNFPGMWRAVRRYGLQIVAGIVVAEIVAVATLMRNDSLYWNWMTLKRVRKRLSERGLRVGQVAPPLQGRTIQGKSFLKREWKRPTLVLFIGNCTPCSRSVLTFWHNFSATQKGVELIVVSSDSVRNIREFLKKEGLHLNILSDVGGVTGRLWGVRRRPKVFLVGKGGRILYVEREGENPAEAVRSILGGV